MESLIERYEIPDLPGVYLMKNQEDTIIYVGKAKNLRKRVLSYFKLKHKDAKTIELVKNIDDFEFILCKSELDALILENNLIKKYMPKYNILLKDQKTYPYIKLSKEKFPKISIINRTKDLNEKKGIFFGPYPSRTIFLLKTLIKIFRIRDCKRDMRRIAAKPCLKYYMSLCTGPCAFKEIEVEYNENIKNAMSFLKGDSQSIVEELDTKMKKLSEEMEFERAIKCREQIKAIDNAMRTQVTEVLKDIDEDVFTFKQEGKLLFLTILKVRDGKVLGVSNIKLDLKLEIEEKEILVEAFVRYYSSGNIPKNIVLDKVFEEKREILEAWSKKVLDVNLKLYFPNIESRRKKVLDMAYLNLDKEIKKHYYQKTIIEEGMKILYDTMDLKKFPRTIECFDISNISGKDAVGAMSVAVEGRLSKKNYRKFKIKTKDTPDDYHMMREVIERRYSKLNEQEFPDLILIDGGLGQLNAVEGVLLKLGKTHLTDIISIAKREEEVFKAGEKIPYIFDKSMESLKILQRLRDEAHRFGITYHRSLRKKRVISSQLQSVEGLGEKREKELLKTFKSVKRIKEADLEELMKVVPEKIARKLKNLK